MNQFCRQIALNVNLEQKPDFMAAEYWAESKGLA